MLEYLFKIRFSGGMEVSLETIEDRIQNPFAPVEEEPGPSDLIVRVVENPASSGPSRTLRNLPSRTSSRHQRANGLPGSVSR